MKEAISAHTGTAPYHKSSQTKQTYFGALRHRLARSTTPGRPPWTPHGPLTPNASPDVPDHQESPIRAGSTSPNQNYRRPELNLSHLT